VIFLNQSGFSGKSRRKLMFAPFVRSSTADKPRFTINPAALAVVAGLSLGALSTVLWPHFAGLVALAMWPLGLSSGLIGVALFNYYWRGEAAWGMVISGQLLGALGTALLLLAALN
jgi:hypothetical protein